MGGYLPVTRPDVPAGARDVLLQLDPGRSATGRLLDAAGAPVSGAGLDVRAANGRRLELCTTRTGADGRFVLTGLPDETVTVRAGRASWKVRAGAREVELRLPR